jgi:hypothetical protein
MRQIAWIERLEDGVKREVRVSLEGKKLKWQSKRTDEESWVYDKPPSEQDWDMFEDLMRRRYQRRRGVDLDTLAMFKQMRLDSQPKPRR